jgi:hypothetical protein
MKLLNLLLEDVEIPFEGECQITIVNTDGDNITVDCEVPISDEEKMTGLMFRDSLDDNSGMFYDNVDGGFWMKNVKFPIEMIFIENDTIVDIKNGKEFDETTIYPPENTTSNLEVNKGFTEKNNINIGNKIYKS